MRVAAVHYHLKPGGVTRVVENAFASLEGRGMQLVALAGEPYEGQAEIHTGVVPGLGYTQPNEKPDPGALWFALKQAAREALGAEPDLWHIHNHSLGKNTAMAQIVGKLAAEKPVLLQIHDFAEDGRPANYASLAGQAPNLDLLYPQAPQVHYGLLNSRDLSFLDACGFPSPSLHLLPNPVALPSLPEAPITLPGYAGKRLLLYPTRAIRRKNLGELLLWSLLGEEDWAFATTLTPANPTARPVYDRWVAFAGTLNLPVRFALGEQVDLSFPQLMAAADAIITTSVAEGFGLAFLEPFLFNRPLVGRNLPEITRDFTNTGVNLSALYPRLMVPLSWAGEDDTRAALESALKDYYHAYDREPPPDAADQALDAMTENGGVDFGRLSEPLQEKIIRRVQSRRDERGQISPPKLPLARAADCVAQNGDLIAQNFSLERYGENLAAIYEKVAASPVERLQYAPSAAMLDQFLDPRRFNLLRT